MDNSAAISQNELLDSECIKEKEPIPLVDGNKSKAYYFSKRTFDIILSFLGIVLLSPIMLITSIIIYIDDPHGSPIYKQTRVGKNGKLFTFYKFRSMIVGADNMLDKLQHMNEKDGPVFKIKDDPRITKFGRFIRKSSIDELPQLVNVLTGDMSIVGPRPPLPNEVAKYNSLQKRRLIEKPGLTCYWQVQQNRDSISFDDWLDLDLKYIQDKNLKVDFKLILDTFKVVFTCQGE